MNVFKTIQKEQKPDDGLVPVRKKVVVEAVKGKPVKTTTTTRYERIEKKPGNEVVPMVMVEVVEKVKKKIIKTTTTIDYER